MCNRDASAFLFLLQCVLSIIFILAADLFTILNNIMFAGSAGNVLTMFGMLYLRWKRPDMKRPFKVCRCDHYDWSLNTLKSVVRSFHVVEVDNCQISISHSVAVLLSGTICISFRHNCSSWHFSLANCRQKMWRDLYFLLVWLVNVRQYQYSAFTSSVCTCTNTHSTPFQ